MDVVWLATVAAYPIIVLVVDLVVRVLAVIYIPRNRRPQTALAWLVLIFVLPVPGILLFFLFGSRRLPKSRRRKQREINSYILETTDGIEQVKRDHPWPAWLEPIVELNRKLGAMPLVGGNTAQMHTDYEESIEAMTAAVDGAKKYVHVEFYILSFDRATLRFFEAMKAATDRGVASSERSTSTSSSRQRASRTSVVTTRGRAGWSRSSSSTASSGPCRSSAATRRRFTRTTRSPSRR